MKTQLFVIGALIPMIVVSGCNEDESKVRMAQEHARRQAEQSQQMVELQREVAEGTKQLVEADAAARKDVIAFQRELQADRSAAQHERFTMQKQIDAERIKLGAQFDELEAERRAIAGERRWDSLLAPAVASVGTLLACLAPLVLCWYLLHSASASNDGDAVCEALLEDIIADEPILFPRPEDRPAITYEADDSPLDDE